MPPSSQDQDVVLVGVLPPGASDLEFASGMEELERLVSTLGYRTIARVTQARSHLDAAAVLGEGKLKELWQPTGGEGVVGSPAPVVMTSSTGSRPRSSRGFAGASPRPGSCRPKTPPTWPGRANASSPSSRRRTRRRRSSSPTIARRS